VYDIHKTKIKQRENTIPPRLPTAGRWLCPRGARLRKNRWSHPVLRVIHIALDVRNLCRLSNPQLGSLVIMFQKATHFFSFFYESLFEHNSILFPQVPQSVIIHSRSSLMYRFSSHKVSRVQGAGVIAAVLLKDRCCGTFKPIIVTSKLKLLLYRFVLHYRKLTKIMIEPAFIGTQDRTVFYRDLFSFWEGCRATKCDREGAVPTPYIAQCSPVECLSPLINSLLIKFVSIVHRSRVVTYLPALYLAAMTSEI
jgi:hypothetical protein